jgi:hypothetical protein
VAQFEVKASQQAAELAQREAECDALRAIVEEAKVAGEAAVRPIPTQSSSFRVLMPLSSVLPRRWQRAALPQSTVCWLPSEPSAIALLLRCRRPCWRWR